MTKFKMLERFKKINLEFIKKAHMICTDHAHFQTMIKTSAKFQIFQKSYGRKVLMVNVDRRTDSNRPTRWTETGMLKSHMLRQA